MLTNFNQIQKGILFCGLLMMGNFCTIVQAGDKPDKERHVCINRNASAVTDIWVVFKTHFDLGFTDLTENVIKRYREEMMDKALNVPARG